MRAVLLAAGRGERLGPLTERLPKILVPLAGRPLLAHQLEYLAGSGVDEVAINVHHHASQVTGFVATWDGPPAIRVYHEPRLLGTAGALGPMLDFLDRTSVCLYGDVVTDVDLRDLVSWHERRGADVTLVVQRARDVAGKGVVELDGAGRVASFVEKPTPGASGRLVNAGVYALDREFVARFALPGCDFGHDAFPRALRSGAALWGRELDGLVCDVGTPAGLRRARRALGGRAPRLRPRPRASRPG